MADAKLDQNVILIEEFKTSYSSISSVEVASENPLMLVVGTFYILALLEGKPWPTSTWIVKQLLVVRTNIIFIPTISTSWVTVEYIVKWSQTLVV